MSVNNSGPVIKKKISPYPIDLQIPREGKVLKLKILKLTERGFLADTGGAIFKIASIVEGGSFQLPASEVVIANTVKVIKNYDSLIVTKEKTRTVLRISEFHFVNLPNEKQLEIREFLVKIKQVTRR